MEHPQSFPMYIFDPPVPLVAEAVKHRELVAKGIPVEVGEHQPWIMI